MFRLQLVWMFFVLTLFSSALVSGNPIALHSNATTPASTNGTLAPIQVTQPNPSSSFNLSQPLVPILVNYIFINPLTEFNNRVSQIAESLPAIFSQNGQQIGLALSQPIHSGALTANQVVSGLNASVTNASKAVPSLLSGPLAWLSRVNIGLTNFTTTAVNRTASQVGQNISTAGASFSNVGKNVQHFGSLFSEWLQAQQGRLDQQLQRMSASMNITLSVQPEPTISQQTTVTNFTTNNVLAEH